VPVDTALWSEAPPGVVETSDSMRERAAVGSRPKPPLSLSFGVVGSKIGRPQGAPSLSVATLGPRSKASRPAKAEPESAPDPVSPGQAVDAFSPAIKPAICNPSSQSPPAAFRDAHLPAVQ